MRERDNDDNDEYVYYFFMERAPARSRGWNGRWVWVVGRQMGVTLYFLSIVKFSCAGCIMRRGVLTRSFKRKGNSKIFRTEC